MPRNSQDEVVNRIRVLIVDDHPVERADLGVLISGQPDLVVCGQAAGCGEALRLSETTRPDLIIVDIALKDGDGIELIKRIKAGNASVRLLVLSTCAEDLYAEHALRAGARGFLGKQESTQTVIEAIRRVLEGKIYLTERMAQRLLRGLVAGSAERSSVEALTHRELHVFVLIGQGLNTRQIAAQLNLSDKTVETYRGCIRTKLKIARGGELAHHARQWVLQSEDGQRSPSDPPLP
jgi:DNA-binding NarL/FixJ family response regulator